MWYFIVIPENFRVILRNHRHFLHNLSWVSSKLHIVNFVACRKIFSSVVLDSTVLILDSWVFWTETADFFKSGIFNCLHQLIPLNLESSICWPTCTVTELHFLNCVYSLQEEAVEIENSGQKEIEDMDLMPRHSSEITEDMPPPGH